MPRLTLIAISQRVAALISRSCAGSCDQTRPCAAGFEGSSAAQISVCESSSSFHSMDSPEIIEGVVEMLHGQDGPSQRASTRGALRDSDGGAAGTSRGTGSIVLGDRRHLLTEGSAGGSTPAACSGLHQDRDGARDALHAESSLSRRVLRPHS